MSPEQEQEETRKRIDEINDKRRQESEVMQRAIQHVREERRQNIEEKRKVIEERKKQKQPMCSACKGTRWWSHKILTHWNCWNCHPPLHLAGQEPELVPMSRKLIR